MNFIAYFTALFLFYIANCMHLQTFESAVDPENLKKTEGIDIIKILNLDPIKTNSSIEEEEAEVLKHKSNSNINY
jgi:hypothetical protein